MARNHPEETAAAKSTPASRPRGAASIPAGHSRMRLVQQQVANQVSSTAFESDPGFTPGFNIAIYPRGEYGQRAIDSRIELVRLPGGHYRFLGQTRILTHEEVEAIYNSIDRTSTGPERGFEKLIDY